MNVRRFVWPLVAVAAFSYGLAAGRHKLFPFDLLLSAKRLAVMGTVEPGDDPRPGLWGRRFAKVAVRSSIDSTDQKAYFAKADAPMQPLVVSLHSWSGTYEQADALAEKIVGAGFNYIHPDTRGPNKTSDACLSDKVIADIDDAIRYAVQNGRADPGRVIVIGSSGGGYTALGHYLKGTQPVHAYVAWNPISDLQAWRNQSLLKRKGFAEDVVRCAESPASRSPLHWPVARRASRLELFTGINDGHLGSVPIDHSLLFFNRIAAANGLEIIPAEDVLRLLSRDVQPLAGVRVGDRQVYYHRESPAVALTVFEGTHETILDHALQRLLSLAAAP